MKIPIEIGKYVKNCKNCYYNNMINHWKADLIKFKFNFYTFEIDCYCKTTNYSYHNATGPTKSLWLKNRAYDPSKKINCISYYSDGTVAYRKHL